MYQTKIMELFYEISNKIYILLTEMNNLLDAIRTISRICLMLFEQYQGMQRAEVMITLSLIYCDDFLIRCYDNNFNIIEFLFEFPFE